MGKCFCFLCVINILLVWLAEDFAPNKISRILCYVLDGFDQLPLSSDYAVSLDKSQNENTKNQTRGSWIRGANSTSVLCHACPLKDDLDISATWWCRSGNNQLESLSGAASWGCGFLSSPFCPRATRGSSRKNTSNAETWTLSRSRPCETDSFLKIDKIHFFVDWAAFIEKHWFG